MQKILVIGCGHMGSALVDSWIKSKKYSLTIIDPNKRNSLKKKYNMVNVSIQKNISNIEKNKIFDFIIFAIKPLDLKNTLDDISNIKIGKHASVISVIAGKKLNLFKKKIKSTNNFFRVMPNMPASIGKSMNCIVASRKIDRKKIKQVLDLFNYSGKTLLLENENQIDMATAISGSGPGFVFNLIDCMEHSAVKLGFKKSVAKILVSQTFKGSIDLLSKNKLSAKKLVNTVATKGGTTEAGLKIMNKYKIHKIFNELTNASYKRAKAQGK